KTIGVGKEPSLGVFSAMTNRGHELRSVLAAQGDLELRMRFDDLAHVGEGPALDDGEGLEDYAAFLELAQDFGRAGARGNVVASGLDLRPSAHAQLQLHGPAISQRTARFELGQH